MGIAWGINIRAETGAKMLKYNIHLIEDLIQGKAVLPLSVANVDYYNNQRYHEGIDNVTPADKYFGRDRTILRQREIMKKKTLEIRRSINMACLS
jgi:hypothetical protein